ncbi:MAG: hypothetical protein DRH20_09850 [Deltaproteobacteria bacterium]|nr:MAG: hypothetical protein DRH20_09850 [Deltaproteobacteria bacterium]
MIVNYVMRFVIVMPVFRKITSSTYRVAVLGPSRDEGQVLYCSHFSSGEAEKPSCQSASRVLQTPLPHDLHDQRDQTNPIDSTNPTNPSNPNKGQVLCSFCVYTHQHLTCIPHIYILIKKARKGDLVMEQVNALKLRNNLGEILDRLNRTGKPILVTKGRKLRAVLVTPDDFEKRFLDVRAREERERFLNEVDSLRKKRKLRTSSVELLRRLRGYEK